MQQSAPVTDNFGETELRSFLARAMVGVAPWPFPSWDETQYETAWQAIAFHGCALAIVEAGNSLAAWPDALRARLLEEARLQALWEASHKARLVRVLDALAAGGVEVLVTKGSALAYSVYPDPALRRRGDSDLLVTPGQAAAARKVLADLGLTLDLPGTMQEIWLDKTASGFAHQFDLHWHSASAPAAATLFSPAEALANAVPLPRLSPSARATDPLRTFLNDALNQALHARAGYLVEGAYRRGSCRLAWSYGTALQAQEFDGSRWRALVQLAMERGAAMIVLRALEAAQRDFAAPVPDDILAMLRAAGDGGAIDRFVFHKDGWEHLRENWANADGGAQRIEVLRAALLPSRAFLSDKYPGMARWPLTALRLRRIGSALWRRLVPRR